jgi:peptidoglycan-N-acetylmuramic acid deacetylase
VLKSLFLPLIIAAVASPIVNWGLQHNTNERTPIAPASGVALLQQYDGFYVADTAEKKVFLTFDLGYEAGHTGAVLDVLKQNNIKAVFFLCGNYLQEKELVGRMIAEGHMIGNHTDRHKDLPALAEDEITKDIMSFQNKFMAEYQGAKPPVFFRPPKGRFDEKTLKIAASNNLRAMLWSSAIVDWGKTPIDAKASANKIISRIHPGAIILFHIANAGTPKMLELLILQLKDKGYTIGNADEI